MDRMSTSPSPDALPPFNPQFIDTPGMGLYYEDGRMTAAVDIHEDEGSRHLVISEWSTEHRNRGCSVEALTWLREQGFTKIVANGVGMLDEGDDGELVGDIATLYWAHMKTKGLVDVLIDDGGTELDVDAEGNLSFKKQAPGKPSMRP